MAATECHISQISGWAESHEYVFDDPHGNHDVVNIGIGDDSPDSFIVAVLTTKSGHVIDALDAQLSVEMPSGFQRYSSERADLYQDERLFVSESQQLFVVNQPPTGNWIISVLGGTMPFSLTILIFSGRNRHTASVSNQGGPPPRCNLCKSVAKALSLAIVVAATLPAMPQALIAIVAKFLGQSIAIAAIFVSSVIGDIVDVISEKLCKAVGLC